MLPFAAWGQHDTNLNPRAQQTNGSGGVCWSVVLRCRVPQSRIPGAAWWRWLCSAALPPVRTWYPRAEQATSVAIMGQLNTFIYSFIHSFIHSSIHSFIHASPGCVAESPVRTPRALFSPAPANPPVLGCCPAQAPLQIAAAAPDPESEIRGHSLPGTEELSTTRDSNPANFAKYSDWLLFTTANQKIRTSPLRSVSSSIPF